MGIRVRQAEALIAENMAAIRATALRPRRDGVEWSQTRRPGGVVSSTSR